MGVHMSFQVSVFPFLGQIPEVELIDHTSFFLSFFFFLKLIYFWLHWVFVAACGLSLVATSGGYSSLRCAGFSLQWLFLL